MALTINQYLYDTSISAEFNVEYISTCFMFDIDEEAHPEEGYLMAGETGGYEGSITKVGHYGSAVAATPKGAPKDPRVVEAERLINKLQKEKDALIKKQESKKGIYKDDR